MKYLVLLFIITDVYALTNRQCRHGVIKCGYKVKNKKKFCTSMSDLQRACVESKIPELQAMEAAEASRKNKKKQAKENIKSYDCDSLSGIQKDICWSLK